MCVCECGECVQGCRSVCASEYVCECMSVVRVCKGVGVCVQQFRCV